MRPFYRKSFNLKILIVFTILLFLVTWASSSLIQVKLNAILEQPQKMVSSPTPPPKTIGVKITSPLRDQQVPVGNNLTVLGISKYNATSNCQVSVILDGIKPYQKTIPLGLAGADYSNWKYTLSPTYQASITEGTNKITAKLLCQANPTGMTKFYSINVTGVNQTVPSPVSSNNVTTAPSVLPVSSNSTLNNPFLDPATNTGNPSATDSLSTDHSNHSAHHHHNHNTKNISHSNKEHSKDSTSGDHRSHEDKGGGQVNSVGSLVTHLVRNLG